MSTGGREGGGGRGSTAPPGDRGRGRGGWRNRRAGAGAGVAPGRVSAQRLDKSLVELAGLARAGEPAALQCLLDVRDAQLLDAGQLQRRAPRLALPFARAAHREACAGARASSGQPPANVRKGPAYAGHQCSARKSTEMLGRSPVEQPRCRAFH